MTRLFETVMKMVTFSPFIKIFKTQHIKTCARPPSCLFTFATIVRLHAFIWRTIDACAFRDFSAIIVRTIDPGEVGHYISVGGIVIIYSNIGIEK